jgi:hypothetical protein
MSKFLDDNGALYLWNKIKAYVSTNAVPPSRKVNNKSLTSDISLNASDVGAEPASASIVKDSNYVHTDENFTSDYKSKVDNHDTLLSGVSVNLQTQINGLKARGLYFGSFDTHEDLLAATGDPKANDYATVRDDETHGDHTTQYKHNGEAWVFDLYIEFDARDFDAEPITSSEIANLTITTTASDPISNSGGIIALLTSISGRIAALLARFHTTTGHKHNGTDSAKIAYGDITGAPNIPDLTPMSNSDIDTITA